jgi:fibronectin type 3 domain-containing protein
VTVAVTFDPQATGAATGTLSVSSNASNSLLQIPLSGGGVSQPAQSSVALNWSPSASAVIGYFVYRGNVTGGPYSKLNSSVDPSSSYTDSTVSGGQTYYYVVTSVDSSNVESAYSNQVAVAIPSS